MFLKSAILHLINVILQWVEASDEYTDKYYQAFLHTPLELFENATGKFIDTNPITAVYSSATEIFPDSYVEYIEDFYGKDESRKGIYIKKTYYYR